ncbi:MAG: ABC transporter substrate-binding protein [Oscillospiraceae bacterium]|nr:ABC transporter substrate-binding protein [Oscillospiraceae bacterium]
MRMRKKRYLGILIAILMLLPILAACANDTNGPADSDTTTQTDPPREEILGVVEGGDDEAGYYWRDPDARHGGTLVFAPGGSGPAQFGDPWDFLLGFAAVTEPFTAQLTAQWPDGSTRLVLSAGYDWGFDEARQLYYVEHTLHENIVLHPHPLHEAEPVDAELIHWMQLTAWENGVIRDVQLHDVEVTGPLSVRWWWYTNDNSRPLQNTAWVTSRLIYEHPDYGLDWLNENPISAGPFRVVEHVTDSHVYFERFENYFMEGRPYLDGVQIVYLGDELMQSIALRADGDMRVHSVAATSPAQAGEFLALGYRITSLPNQTITFVMQNDAPADAPLMNPLVRQAISMAINRQMITDSLGFGVHVPTLQFVPPQFAGHIYDPEFGAPAYNPARARELLAEAGFAPGEIVLDLLPQPSSVTDSQAVAIQSMLQAVGIESTITIMVGADHSELRRETGWGPDQLMIGNYISWFTPGDSARMNFRHRDVALPTWISLVPGDEIEDMIDVLGELGDRTAEFQDFQRYMLDWNNLHLIPLWQQGAMRINHPQIGGILPADHMLFWYRLWMREEGTY